MADPRDPRGLRDDAPLLDAWLTFTAQAEQGKLTPMSVPGHKQRQGLTQRLSKAPEVWRLEEAA